ncbi:MAG: purine-nucleoside phosphorylase [Chloroflexi bacterium]|nr:purine-nucleoside phosphorylase [Chloroflexota bacterium]
MDTTASAEYIRNCTAQRPRIAVVTGSGLDALASMLNHAEVIRFGEIPSFPQATVEGHKGEFCFGTLAGKPIVVARGRVHYYEGYSPKQVTHYVRVLKLLGVETLILTNAAGGLNMNYRAGDIMLISDHLNFVGMAGHNPLFGPNDASYGPRFPSMNPAYDPALRAMAKSVAAAQGLTLREGIYAAVAGPSFETAAELRMLAQLGGDAVGMSTANETVVAVHAGLKVLGLSLISNMATGEPAGERFTAEELHHEVLDAGTQAAPRMIALIKGVIERL